jgi:hypothetical protein
MIFSGGDFERREQGRGVVPPVRPNVGDRLRQREHQMVVGQGQQFSFALCQPFLGGCTLALRTVPIAAGNGRRPLPALD